MFYHLMSLTSLNLIWNQDCFSSITYSSGISLKIREMKSFAFTKEAVNQISASLITKDYGRSWRISMLQSSELILLQVMMQSLEELLMLRSGYYMTTCLEKFLLLNPLCIKVLKRLIQRKRHSTLSKIMYLQVFWKSWLDKCLLIGILHQRIIVLWIQIRVCLHPNRVEEVAKN